jgi:hypothetical protein
MHRSGRLYEWVWCFHCDHLCRLADTTPLYGSYNDGIWLEFPDDTAWLIRFPRVGKVQDSYADEKVTMKVAAINLIRKKTTIPVPRI